MDIIICCKKKVIAFLLSAITGRTAQTGCAAERGSGTPATGQGSRGVSILILLSSCQPLRSNGAICMRLVGEVRLPTVTRIVNFVLLLPRRDFFPEEQMSIFP